MSDTFNHEAEAWDSLNYDLDHFDYANGGDGPVFRSTPINPLYYHTKVQFLGIERETAKSYLVDFGVVSLWVPKSIVKRLDTENLTAWLHKKTFEEIKRSYKGRVNEISYQKRDNG